MIRTCPHFFFYLQTALSLGLSDHGIASPEAFGHGISTLEGSASLQRQYSTSSVKQDVLTLLRKFNVEHIPHGE